MHLQIEQFSDEIKDLMKTVYQNPFRGDFVKVNGVTMPEKYEKLADAIENFQVRDDDVWVCSFPKTGTTWSQEMVWCIANDLDYERAKVPLTDRFPYFDISAHGDFPAMVEANPGIQVPSQLVDSFNYTANVPSPRFIKTHLPFNLLPRQLRTGEKRPKIIYIVRNVKDTCISYYHFMRILEDLQGSFEDWCNLFLNDAVMYGPFWKHALGYWKKRIDENLLFLKYEDMKKDLPRVIKKTATFLEKNLTTDQLSSLTEHLSFENMKANPAVNNEHLIYGIKKLTQSKVDGKFMRSGEMNQWKSEMSPDIIERFDQQTRENLKGTRLYF
ncbi:luciferin sulfotransferase [Neodiprion lecontei]|uniref:Luciferin sulfotransferase n=1 Tax=Neodiprion lecontei TaxID=441921 RepID=A0ABM3FPQ3_NEOLC|nr:luciferin sulfotransferase [Neodiprion lecontei]